MQYADNARTVTSFGREEKINTELGLNFRAKMFIITTTMCYCSFL